VLPYTIVEQVATVTVAPGRVAHPKIVNCPFLCHKLMHGSLGHIESTPQIQLVQPFLQYILPHCLDQYTAMLIRLAVRRIL